MIIEVMGRNAGWIALHAGVASGGERLVLTSYQAIRGADAVTANGEVKVAAWDVASNLAVLVLPAKATTTLESTDDVLDVALNRRNARPRVLACRIRAALVHRPILCSLSRAWMFH